MPKEDVITTEGVAAYDLMQASRNAQWININGNYYVITEATTRFNNNPNERCVVQLKQVKQDDMLNRNKDTVEDMQKALRQMQSILQLFVEKHCD